MTLTDRVQIQFSFAYPSGLGYGSTSSTTFTSSNSVSMTGLSPVVGVQVSVVDRTTGNAATVYSSETGTGVISSLVTDSGGNVPGWVNSGSYTIVVAAQGSFAGASINFDAVRGDGVTRIAPGTVTTPTIALEVVDYPQLTPDVVALINSIAGLQAAITAALAGFGGKLPTGMIATFVNAPPPGWLPMLGQFVPILDFPQLYAVLGTGLPDNSHVDLPPGVAPLYAGGYYNSHQANLQSVTLPLPPPGYFTIPLNVTAAKSDTHVGNLIGTYNLTTRPAAPWQTYAPLLVNGIKI